MEYKEIAEGVTTQNDTHDLTVTNVSPYVGWSTKRLNLWGSVGLGKGEVEIHNGATLLQESSDIKMRTIAAGVSGKLLETEAGSIVRLKGNALQTEIDVESNGAGIPTEKLDANRLRVAVQPPDRTSYPILLRSTSFAESKPGGASGQPAIELSISPSTVNRTLHRLGLSRIKNIAPPVATSAEDPAR